MTTVVWDGESIASDSRATAGGTVLAGKCQKIFRNKGAVYAVCGEVATAIAMKDWLIAGADPDDYPMFNADEYTVLMIKDRVGYVYAGERFPFEVSPPFAMGTGKEIALGALLAGADIQQAVEIACQLDPESAAPVKVLKV